MIRGISFEVPNERYPLLYLITRGIEISKYFWILVEEDVHKGNENYFKKDRYPGSEFEQVITDEDCYSVLLNLQAYFAESDFIRPKNYSEFLTGKCQLIVFVNDCCYIDIYAKDIEIIEKIKGNAQNNGFGSIEYITEANDRRTGSGGFSA